MRPGAERAHAPGLTPRRRSGPAGTGSYFRCYHVLPFIGLAPEKRHFARRCVYANHIPASLDRKPAMPFLPCLFQKLVKKRRRDAEMCFQELRYFFLRCCVAVAVFFAVRDLHCFRAPFFSFTGSVWSKVKKNAVFMMQRPPSPSASAFSFPSSVFFPAQYFQI